MAWGRKARRIAELVKDRERCAERAYRAEGAVEVARAERDIARIDAKAFKRKAEDLEKVKKAANDEAAARRVELREAKARQLELEWAVALLNIACGRTGDDVGSPVTGVTPAELEQAKEAVRERDVVVRWDELAGVPTVHFPKKDQRRAPWAQGGMYMVPGAVELVYPGTVL